MASVCPVGHPSTWSCSTCEGADQYAPAPAAAHFNARGELIPYVVVPEARGVALVPKDDSPVKAAPGSPETDDDMELAYPDDEPTAPPPPPQASSPASAPVSAPAPAPAFSRHYRSASASAPPTRTLPPRRPPSTRISVPRVSKALPTPLTSRSASASSTSTTTSTTSTTTQTQTQTQTQTVNGNANGTGNGKYYRFGRPGRPPKKATPAPAPVFSSARTPTQAQTALPRPPMYGAGLMMPPPVPVNPTNSYMASMPIQVPVPTPMAMLPPPLPPSPAKPAPLPPAQAEPQVGCVTAGCGGTVPESAKGKRCLKCVRGSWIGRKDAMEKEREAKEKEARERTKLVEKLLKEVERERAKQREKQLLKERERKDGGTPKTQRVTIKLKVTPKPSVGEKTEAEESSVKRIASEESADIVDKKGKGKAVEGSAEAEVNPKEDHGEEVGIWGGAGWDSELSDLTSSGGESEVEEAPRISLKIRIPARTPASSPTKPSTSNSPAAASGSGSADVSALPTPPASVGGTPEAQRLCTIARCRVPLPPFSLYRWKCCSACRKQYREYQRARLGRVAIANAAASAPAPEGPVGPNGTPPAPPPLDLPAPVWRERAERTPAEVEALRAHTAQKEWERKENLRALELAGVHPRKYREPRETKEDTEENDKGTTWTVATAAALKQPERRVEGARACIGRLCEHVIPSEIEYDWTMCGGCRGRERRKAERVLVKEGKLPAPAAGAVLDITGDFPVVEVPKPGRCMYADCGIMMPADAEGPAAACEQCVRRRTAQRRMPGRPPGSRNKPKPKLPDEKPLSTQTPPTDAPEKPLEAPKKRKRVSPYPTYQCREILLKDFGTRFRGFIEAQSYYFLIRGGMGPQPPAQSMFDFSGEYSVVAVDLDVVARKSEIEQGVHNVKDAFARAGGLEFSPTSWVSILGKPGGVVTRFACVHLVNVFLPIRVPGHQPNPATTKSMQGELEIAVLPDDSHKYFPGEKTIVRFRLVG